MKAVLEFNLEEEEDRMAHFRCVKSLDMALAMWQFSVELRKTMDNSEGGKGVDEALVWKTWYEALDEYGIRFDELIR